MDWYALLAAVVAFAFAGCVLSYLIGRRHGDAAAVEEINRVLYEAQLRSRQSAVPDEPFRTLPFEDRTYKGGDR